MWVDVRSKDIKVGSDFRAVVERRLRFALGRFGSRVARVTVHLADVNGPRGAPDKRCRIVVRLPPGQIAAEDTNTDLRAALDRATDRIEQAVDRELERRRDRSDRPEIQTGRFSV
jgi:ribosomal subunit interface protein